MRCCAGRVPGRFAGCAVWRRSRRIWHPCAQRLVRLSRTNHFAPRLIFRLSTNAMYGHIRTAPRYLGYASIFLTLRICHHLVANIVCLMSWGNLKKFQDSEQSIRLAGKNAKKFLILKIILCVRIRRNIDSANAHQRCFVTHAIIFCRNTHN